MPLCTLSLRRTLAFAAAALLAACTSPAKRIETALEAHGVPAPQARCMGAQLAERLSPGQLVRLNSLAKANATGRPSLGRLLDQLDRQGDPKLVGAVAAAGLHCVI